MEKSRLKNTIRNNVENFNLNREMDLIVTNNTNDKILGDREIFNKFSNENEQLDMTNVKHDEFNYGMPIFNGQILNNKKSLISSPYIIENNNKNSFAPSHLSLDSNDMYAIVDDNSGKKFDNDVFSNMAYNNNNNFTISKQEREKDDMNSICKVEEDILNFEFELNFENTKDFLVDVSSPFAIGYLWKSIILLSKNPTTDKILKLLGVKNKDNLINDMKYNSEVFADAGSLEFVIPNGNRVINTNFISKIENLYGVLIKPEERDDGVCRVNLNYMFNLEIPFYYQPKIIFGLLQNYNRNKIKFIEMTNVPINLNVLHKENLVILEIPMSSNMVLGFLYDTNRQHIRKIPNKLIYENRTPDVVVKKLIIPKIKRNKQTMYSKRFKEELSNVHLGEVTYGMMLDLEIMVNMGLNITVSNAISKDKYEIKRNIDYININHKCFYYIKNTNIENKILSTGFINYK